MRKRMVLWASAALAACTSQPPPRVARAELNKLTGNTFEVVPAAEQMPYCLLYTLTEDVRPPIIRQLTMTHENRSVPCQAGKPVGGVTYRVPIDEGKIRVLLFLSDQKLNAGSVGQQIWELSVTNPHFMPMELRLPGKVFVEVMEFTPAAEAASTTGRVISQSGAADAAALPPPDAGAGAAAEPGPK